MARFLEDFLETLHLAPSALRIHNFFMTSPWIHRFIQIHQQFQASLVKPRRLRTGAGSNLDFDGNHKVTGSNPVLMLRVQLLLLLLLLLTLGRPQGRADALTGATMTEAGEKRLSCCLPTAASSINA
eukprot:Filipodium_phascolosomae@DN2399_c0_g1_i1.p1